MTDTAPPGGWRAECLADRERSALALAEFYARDPHGTVGHNLLLLVAKLAGLLDQAEAGVQWSTTPRRTE